MSPQSKDKDFSSSETIDKDKIVKAALHQLNHEGIDGLSMRRLADLLGIRAASLYWHVKNKAELLQLIADSFMKEITYPKSSLSWQEQLFTIAHQYRRILLTYRDSAQIMADTPPFTPHRLRVIEYIYRLYEKSGLSEEDIPLAAALYNNFVVSFVMDEVRIMKQINAVRTNESTFSIEIPQDMLQGIPVKEFPLFSKLTFASKSLDMDQQFNFGLQVLIEGLKAKINKNPSNS